MTQALVSGVDSEARGGTRRAIRRLWAEAARRGSAMLPRLMDRCGIAIATRQSVADREADLTAARAEAALWRARAAALASRAEDLEHRVEESRMVAMDLRARVVCLHGKLATTAATARYQSFTTALEGRSSVS